MMPYAVRGGELGVCATVDDVVLDNLSDLALSGSDMIQGLEMKVKATLLPRRRKLWYLGNGAYRER